ncbi:MAG: YybH family protein [Gemmatimonas sp.]|nr:nuclear transport factor 2 family protein [Gemmatimonadaceae bacterium]
MPRSLTYAGSLTVLSLLALIPVSPPRYTSALPGARSELRDSLLALDRRWGQAYVHGDSAFVAGFVAEDWQGWFDDHAENKASALAEVIGTPHILEDRVDQATVRIFGQMAVIQGRERNRVRDATGEHWETRHITDVLVRRREGWVVVASHDSRIPNP